MSSVAYNKKYRSLFRKAKTRYKVITGGRGSAKSYAISSALVCDTYNDSYYTLFTRYTMVAAHDSIIPEFTDKIDLFRLENDFHITKRDVINTSSGAGILFRGLMVSSKNQVARLKSIAKVKRFIIDEAQELTDEELFDTIDFSIRTTEVDNEIWIIWNPPRDKNHWIYRRFFKDAGVDITHNGIVGDVEYIYTTYLDNLRNLDDSFIMQAQKMKEKDRDKYDNVFLGIPVGFKEGQIYRWTAMPESEWEPERVSLCYGVDWGYTNDQTAVVRVDYDKETNTVYLKEVMYEREMQPRDVARAIREDMERSGCGKSVLVYCDPARPEHIAELRRHNLNACKAVNKNKAGRINYLQGFTVFYDGEDIGEEADNYSFKPHPNDKTMFTNEPEDGKDHCFVADTIITARDGGKRIADIVIGDEVLTSEGWRKVLKVWDNGEKEVLLMSLNFGKFKVLTEATPDHLFKTDKGWKQLQLLRKTDRLFLHSGSMGEFTGNTPEGSTTRRADGNCTATCGNTLTALSRKVTRFITRILTLTITALITWCACLLKNITRYTRSTIRRTERLKGNASISTTYDRSLPIGIEAKKDGSGTASTQESKSAKILRWCALCAERNTQQRTRHRSIVLTDAMPKAEGKAVLTTKQESAHYAGSRLKQTSTASNNIAVCLAVQSIDVLSQRKARVYDLTVEGCHEFFANGVLVHNCMDAANYGAVTHLRRLGIANDDDMR
jgi:PBSX family phage terminase large subunit